VGNRAYNVSEVSVVHRGSIFRMVGMLIGCSRFTGTQAQIDETIGAVAAIAKQCNGGALEFSRNAEEQVQLWSARKQALWSMLALRKGDEAVWSTDVAVPLSRLAELVELSKNDMDDLGMFAMVLGHIGDGNFHESIVFDPKDTAQVQKVAACVQRMVDRAIAMEGTCTGEHGIGIGKKNFLLEELGPSAVDTMRKLKGSLDPYWVMNPGKIFDHACEDNPVGH